MNKRQQYRGELARAKDMLLEFLEEHVLRQYCSCVDTEYVKSALLRRLHKAFFLAYQSDSLLSFFGVESITIAPTLPIPTVTGKLILEKKEWGV